MAEAVLQISGTQVRRLADKGAIRTDRGLLNLADILERYKQLLRVNGGLDEKVEAVCVRAFEEGMLPQDVVVKYSFGIEHVHAAWNAWNALRADPLVAEKLREREQDKAVADAARCKGCHRLAKEANADTLAIVREVTADPRRRSFAITEERAFADLDVRCPTCRAIKATAPIDTMRARFRRLPLLGEPQPIKLDPLPPAPTPPSENAAAAPPPMGDPILSDGDPDEIVAR